MDALQKEPDGSLTLQTPPDPRTGASFITLDPLEWIHRITAHIPNPGQHTRRLHGAYSNRSRGRVSSPWAQDFTGNAAHSSTNDEDSAFTRETRRGWARLLRKIFDVDPLLCPKCGGELKVVSVITDPRVVDHILKHLKSEACRARDPSEPRAPPRISGKLLG